MTEPDDPLHVLWAADEPPARDRAFTAAAMALAGAQAAAIARRRSLVLRVLRGLGLGAGASGAAMLLGGAGLDSWTFAILACAFGGAFWTGRGLFADA